MIPYSLLAEQAQLFNKKKKQQEERDARIRADLAARQEWLLQQKQSKQQQEEAKKLPAHQPGAPAHAAAHRHSHSKRSSSSGHKAVIEVGALSSHPFTRLVPASVGVI